MSTMTKRIERLEATTPLRMRRPEGLEGDAFCEFVLGELKADISNRSMPHAMVRRRWHAWLDTLTREEDRSSFWDRALDEVASELGVKESRGVAR